MVYSRNTVPWCSRNTVPWCMVVTLYHGVVVTLYHGVVVTLYHGVTLIMYYNIPPFQEDILTRFLAIQLEGKVPQAHNALSKSRQ